MDFQKFVLSDPIALAHGSLLMDLRAAHVQGTAFAGLTRARNGNGANGNCCGENPTGSGASNQSKGRPKTGEYPHNQWGEEERCPLECELGYSECLSRAYDWEISCRELCLRLIPPLSIACTIGCMSGSARRQIVCVDEWVRCIRKCPLLPTNDH